MELFIFGTFWFWMLVVIEVIALFTLTVKEKSFSGVFSLAVFASLLSLFGDFNVFKYIWNHPAYFAVFIVSYICLGTGYACIRWFKHVNDIRLQYEDIKRAFLEKHMFPNSKSIPLELRERWKKELGVSFSHSHSSPKIRHHKNKWMTWAILWPISFIEYFWADFFFGLFNNIYRSISGWLQRKSDEIWAKSGINEDLD